MANTSVMARIRMTVDMPVGKWGRKADLDQLSEQVRKEGLHIVENMVREKGGKCVGEPKVVFVMAEEE